MEIGREVEAGSLVDGRAWKRWRQALRGPPGLRQPVRSEQAPERPALPVPLVHAWLLGAALRLLLGSLTLFAFLSLKTVWYCDTLESEDKCLIKGFNLI